MLLQHTKNEVCLPREVKIKFSRSTDFITEFDSNIDLEILSIAFHRRPFQFKNLHACLINVNNRKKV